MHAMQHATLLLVLTSKTHALSADPSKGFAIFARNVMRGNQRCFSRVADDLAQRGLPNGARVLDLGASAGEPSLTIASRGFRVVSTDFAPPNKALGATRAAAFGLSDRVEFHTADAQDLSRWGDGTFDACVGTYVLMFTPDVERVCREVRRVLKPGAPFITTAWQQPARVDICLEIKILRRVRAESPRRPPRRRRAALLDGVAMPDPRRSAEPGRPRHRREMT